MDGTVDIHDALFDMVPDEDSSAGNEELDF